MIDIVAHIPTTSAHRPDTIELGVVAMNVNVLAAWRWQCSRRVPRRSTSSPFEPVVAAAACYVVASVVEWPAKSEGTAPRLVDS